MGETFSKPPAAGQDLRKLGKVVPPGTILNEEQMKSMKGSNWEPNKPAKPVDKAAAKAAREQAIAEDSEVPEEIRNAKTPPKDLRRREVDITTLNPEHQKQIMEATRTMKDLTSEIEQPEMLQADQKIQEAIDLGDNIEEEETQQEPDQCPFCGWDKNIAEPNEPEEGDYREFLRCTKFGKRFSKSYDLFGGGVVMTFRTNLVPETDLLYEQLRADVASGIIASQPDFEAMFLRYRFVLALQELQSGGEITSLQVITEYEKPEKGTEIKVAEARTVGEWPEVLYTAGLNSLRRFEELCRILTSRAHSPDFWKQAGGQPDSLEPAPQEQSAPSAPPFSKRIGTPT